VVVAANVVLLALVFALPDDPLLSPHAAATTASAIGTARMLTLRDIDRRRRTPV
jgi:hypothetical protein